MTLLPRPSSIGALPIWGARLLALLVAAVSVAMLYGGALLAVAGGSLFYLLTGIVLLAAAVLLWRGRRSGAWALVGLLVLTLLWALWESGLDAWALLPRLWLAALLAGLGGLLLLRSMRARLWLLAGSFAAIALLLGGLVAVSLVPGRGEAEVSRFAAAADDGEWRSVGRNQAADRFSPLAEITPANVADLEVAWVARLGYRKSGKPSAIEVTPLKVRDTLYLCDTESRVVALDPDTGALRWRFSPPKAKDTALLGVCRGVTYHAQPGATGPCAERIVTATLLAKMYAVDARNGRRCADFGDNGEVDLTVGMGEIQPGYYFVTSAPTLVRGKMVVGGWVLDGQETEEPSGVIRAFDAVTGELAWAWDMGRPDEPGLPPAGQPYTRGTPNSWAPMTADEALGMVYVPMGNATPDYVSAHRSDAANRYSTSTVALDAETGRVRWSYQQVHRDVWDYDNASPPTLFDMPTPAGPVPALVQPTKRGEFFVLDRRNGRPLVETVEKPAPGRPVPGERLSPTQPFPVGMPSFSGGRLREADMWGLSPFDQMWCRLKFVQARYDGEFTPIGLEPTIVYPGFLGGSEWGGVAVDPDRRLMVVNVNHFAMYNQMVTRAEADLRGIAALRDKQSIRKTVNISPQMGTPYSADVNGFRSPLGVPCTQPPYGEIAAIDLATRRTVWRKPLGTGRDAGPFDIPSNLPITMGVPNIGGSLVTRSGLTFIGATQEKAFRAFDTRSGKLLWYRRLPAGGHANPMSYRSDATGRQYVVIAASGHFAMRNGQGDALIAYALPKGEE